MGGTRDVTSHSQTCWNPNRASLSQHLCVQKLGILLVLHPSTALLQNESTATATQAQLPDLSLPPSISKDFDFISYLLLLLHQTNLHLI